MFQKLRSYVDNNDFEMNITNSYINLNNYEEITTLTDTIIGIRYNQNHYLTIKGKNLSIKKLLNQELLLTGEILDIHFYIS